MKTQAVLMFVVLAQPAIAAEAILRVTESSITSRRMQGWGCIDPTFVRDGLPAKELIQEVYEKLRQKAQESCGSLPALQVGDLNLRYGEDFQFQPFGRCEIFERMTLTADFSCG